MMAEARKNEVKGVGYVVVWFEDHIATPLRAFFSPGAASEFCQNGKRLFKAGQRTTYKNTCSHLRPGESL